MIAAAETTVLRTRARLSSLAPVRARLAAALERGGWTGDEAARVVLVASEALTNAIEHGSVPGARVEVGLSVGPDAVGLRVRDAGRSGRTGWTPPGPPAAHGVRGRGLLIMRALSDDLDLRAGADGTELRLGFCREPAAVPA